VYDEVTNSPVLAYTYAAAYDGAVFLRILDGNGNLSTDSTSVRVASGLAPLSFAPPVSNGAEGAQNVRVTDFNRDGRNDLAMRNDLGWSLIWLGNGNGTFQGPTGAGDAGYGSSVLAVGDVNGDAKPDYIGAYRDGSEVSVLLGNGDGTFQNSQFYACGISTVTDIVLSDLNNDSRNDIIAVGENKVSVLLGNGNGSFQSATQYTTGNSPRTAVARDVNRDGWSDLAVVNAIGNTVSILIGNGNGTLRPKVDYAVGAAPVDIAAGDFNNDLITDLVVANSGNQHISVLLGNSNGTFQTARSVSVSGSAVRVAVGRLDHDGNHDIVVKVDRGADGQVLALRGNGDGTFQTATTLATTSSSRMDMALGEFNGDGRMDIVNLDLDDPSFSYKLLLSRISTSSTPTATPTSAPTATPTNTELRSIVTDRGEDFCGGQPLHTSSFFVRPNADWYNIPSATATPTATPPPGGGVPTSGLGLWLKADTGVTLSGSAVTQWADQSGNVRNASQSNSTNRPVLVSNALNGKPAIRFDGGNDFLSFTYPINGLNGVTMFLVSAARDADNPSGPQNAAVYWPETASWGATFLSAFQSKALARIGTGQTNTNLSYTRPANIGTAYTRTSVKHDGANGTNVLYVNGVAVQTATGRLSALNGIQNNGFLGQGLGSTSTTNTYFNGDIVEVLVYSRALSEAERQQVEQYLQQKYFPS
jgi:hypothetical protein